MASPSLPAAFAFLRGPPTAGNLATDAALVEVLPHLQPPAREAALAILLERSHPPSLAALVGGLNDYEDALQRLILAHVGDLSAGLRVAIASPSFADHAGAIEVIVRSDSDESAYLLADAVRSKHRRTRELAAAGLHRMTARLLDRFEAKSPAGARIPSRTHDRRERQRSSLPYPSIAGGDSCEGGDEIGISSQRVSSQRAASLNAKADRLAEALGTAVRHWEIHFQPKVLEAAAWLGDRVEPALLNKLQEPRTTITKALNDLLEGTSDPRLAGFVLRALAVPDLRPAAARAICRPRDTALIRAVFTQSWLLADARIERGCRWIRTGPWLRDAVGVVLELEGAAAAGAVHFLAAIGGPVGHRSENSATQRLFRELNDSGHDEVRRAVVWQLVHDESEAATDLLTVVAARPGDSAATMAEHELRRRRPGAYVGAVPADPAAEPESAHRAGVLLRAQMASSEPLNRARALRIARRYGLAGELDEWIHRLAHDPDPMVRSLAVSMLAKLPGPTTHRILRAAVNDPDERVQANAIEALDRLDIKERVRCTEPKLNSPNCRVRANAIKSLLRAEVRQAGRALLDMLEDPSRAHRLSALWVVRRLRLQAVFHRVREMSRSDPDERVRRCAKRVLEDPACDRPVHRSAEGGFKSAAEDAPIHDVGGPTW